MKARTFHFNIILLLLTLAASCQTGQPPKELARLSLHLEVNPDGTDTSRPAPICRAQPVMVNVETAPFVDERDLETAAVIDWMDGFAIRLRFNAHGALMLETATRTNPGRRLAVHAEFGETRWLAAPLVSHPITDGVFSFTPDTTREEAERIVRGLNNVAAEIKKNSK